MGCRGLGRDRWRWSDWLGGWLAGHGRGGLGRRPDHGWGRLGVHWLWRDGLADPGVHHVAIDLGGAQKHRQFRHFFELCPVGHPFGPSQADACDLAFAQHLVDLRKGQRSLLVPADDDVVAASGRDRNRSRDGTLGRNARGFVLAQQAAVQDFALSSLDEHNSFAVWAANLRPSGSAEAFGRQSIRLGATGTGEAHGVLLVLVADSGAGCDVGPKVEKYCGFGEPQLNATDA